MTGPLSVITSVIKITDTLIERIQEFINRRDIAEKNKRELENLIKAYRTITETLPQYQSAVKGALSSNDLFPLDYLTLTRHLNELQDIVTSATEKFESMETNREKNILRLRQYPVLRFFSRLRRGRTQETTSEQADNGEGEETTSGQGEHTPQPIVRSRISGITHADRDSKTIQELKDGKTVAFQHLEDIQRIIKENYGIFDPKLPEFKSSEFKIIHINYNDNTCERNLRDKLIRDINGTSAPVYLCIQGQGGTGKTTALQHICFDQGVKQKLEKKFTDGIHFMKIGVDAKTEDIIHSISKCVENSGFKPVAAKIRESRTVQTATTMASNIYRNRNVLFIADDWHPPESKYLPNFKGMLGNNTNSVLLVSTRYRMISNEFCPENRIYFTPLQPVGQIAKSVLLQNIHRQEYIWQPDEGTEFAFNAILRKCRGIKLFLAIAGREIRSLKSENDSIEDCVKRHGKRVIPNETFLFHDIYDIYETSYKEVTIRSLQYCDSAVKGLQVTWNYQNNNVIITEAKQLFKGFCVVEKQQRVPLAMVCRLWRTKIGHATQIVRRLKDCCLLNVYDEVENNAENNEEELVSIQIDDTEIDVAQIIANEQNEVDHLSGPSNCLEWHKWLVHGYLRDTSIQGDEGEDAVTHTENNFNSSILEEELCRPTKWCKLGAEEEYFVRNVSRHLIEGKMIIELQKLVLNVEWTLQRIKIGGLPELKSDFSKLETACGPGLIKEIKIVRDVLDSSWERICNSPHSLGFEVFRRISKEDRENTTVEAYMKSIKDWGRKPWLRPVMASLLEQNRQELNQIVINQPVSNVYCTSEDKITVVAKEANKVFVYSDVLQHAHSPTVICKSLHDENVVSTAYHVQTCAVVCGLKNGQIHLHDAKNGALLKDLVGHETAVTCLALSEAGNWLMSGSDDHTVRLWDVTTSHQIGSSFTLPEEDRENIYTEWLKELLNSRELDQLCVGSLHQEVGKIVRRMNWSLEPLPKQCSTECRPCIKDRAIRHSLVVDDKNVNVEIEGKETVIVASVPSDWTSAIHEKVTLHVHTDGRILICKLEQ